MLKNNKVAFGLFVVVFMVLWNTLDYIWSVFISNGSYQFSSGKDLGLPLVSALILGYLFFLRNDKSSQ